MSPPDRLEYFAIVGVCWTLGLCAVVAGPIVGVLAIPFLLGIALDIIDEAGTGPTILFAAGVLALLPLSRAAVRARLRRAACLRLILRNRSAGAPAQPI